MRRIQENGETRLIIGAVGVILDIDALRGSRIGMVWDCRNDFV